MSATAAGALVLCVLRDEHLFSNLQLASFHKRTDAWKQNYEQLQNAIKKIREQNAHLKAVLRKQETIPRKMRLKGAIQLVSGSHAVRINHELLNVLRRQPALLEYDNPGRVDLETRTDHRVLTEREWDEGGVVILHGPARYADWRHGNVYRSHDRYTVLNNFHHHRNGQRMAHLYTGGWTVRIAIGRNLRVYVPPNNWIDLREFHEGYERMTLHLS